MGIYEMLLATFAVVGQEMPDLAIKAIAADLAGYDEHAIGQSLTRCRKELRRITLADIIERIEGEHPGNEEAWAIVKQTINNESVSIAWTRPMQQAYAVAYNMSDDLVAGRMAFKEAYQRAVSVARANSEKPHWQLSPGTDANGREEAAQKAAALNALIEKNIHQLPPPKQRALT